MMMLLLFPIVGFSQSIEDEREITELLVNKYARDTIEIFHKFDNSWLIKNVEEAKSRFEIKKMEEIDLRKDSVSIDEQLAIFDDNVTIKFEGVKIKYSNIIRKLNKANKKRLNTYVNGKFQKRKKKTPFVFISSPIISENGKYAVVYCSYVCDGLCGNGGYQFLKKINNKWVIDKYEIRWVS